MEKKVISKFANASNLFLNIGLIILNFCPIMAVKHAQSDSIRVVSIVSPFLTTYSISTIFLLLIPLVLNLLINITSFFMRNKWLNFLGLLFSIYDLVVFASLLFVFEFTLVGVILGLFLAMLMFALSIFKICINRNERGKI